MLHGGKYELLEEMGKGVFSHVFKAAQKPGNQPVVIKIYKAFSGGTNYAAHAKEEIDILNHLESVDGESNVFGTLLQH